MEVGWLEGRTASLGDNFPNARKLSILEADRTTAPLAAEAIAPAGARERRVCATKKCGHTKNPKLPTNQT